jgi:hypothetical protein
VTGASPSDGVEAQPGDVELGPRAVRLAALLETTATRTVALSDVWTLWAAADPASAGRPERRTELARALEQLTAAGLVTPSKKRDVSAAPHLPARLTLPPPAPSPSANTLARTVVWRPELAWVLGARLTVGQVEHLRLINSWLRDRGRDDDFVPSRERSVEVLGHEKALDSLLTTSVFGPQRLTLSLLRTFRSHPPLPTVRVGDGPVLLVVENEDTFFSTRTVLAADPGPVSHVAWGAGAAFEASVRSCADLPGVERVRYFGDLDAAGLRIPRNAAETAAREGLPAVTPAHGLYRGLLTSSVRQAGQSPVSPDIAGALTRWMADPDLQEQCSILLQTGVRVPQEALSLTLLGADRHWLTRL